MIRRLIHQISLLAAALLTISCASHKDDLDKRLEHRNDHYSNYQARRALRTEARQERTDRWFDRLMGKPSRSETGLKLPD
ncbi:MAG: hypothetical protein WCN98_00370 [Verrucomicrobiaceae bacterium]